MIFWNKSQFYISRGRDLQHINLWQRSLHKQSNILNFECNKGLNFHDKFRTFYHLISRLIFNSAVCSFWQRGLAGGGRENGDMSVKERTALRRPVIILTYRTCGRGRGRGCAQTRDRITAGSKLFSSHGAGVEDVKNVKELFPRDTVNNLLHMLGISSLYYLRTMIFWKPY